MPMNLPQVVFYLAFIVLDVFYLNPLLSPLLMEREG
jgi:hypothetical protein